MFRTSQRKIIYIYVCVCVCAYICLWHVSMRIFNLFMIPYRNYRLRAFVTDINNQLAWKYIKNLPFGLRPYVAGRLVDNALYVKLTEDQVRISLNRTFMYFPCFFIPPLFLKVHKNSYSMVKWLFFFIIDHITASVCYWFYHFR